MLRTNISIRTLGETLWTDEMEAAKNNEFALGRIKDESGILQGEIIDLKFLNTIGSDMNCAEYAYCENFLI